MVDIMDVYKSVDINIGTVMKNAEMLKFVPEHLKSKKICKYAVKNLSIKICITLSIKICS